MENNKSLTVNKKQLPALRNKNGVAKSVSFSNEINEAWELYREQLQRNFELMKVISEQQRVIEQFVSSGMEIASKKEEAPVTMPFVVPPIETSVVQSQPEQKELKSISYERIAKVGAVYKKIVSGKLTRNDALANHLNMLYLLYQMEEATPEKWFMQTGMPESTAYRYATFMRKYHMIKSVRGKYMLTSIGRMLMEAKADTPAEQEELMKTAKEHDLKFGYKQHLPHYTLPENQDFFNANYSGM